MMESWVLKRSLGSLYTQREREKKNRFQPVMTYRGSAHIEKKTDNWKKKNTDLSSLEISGWRLEVFFWGDRLHPAIIIQHPHLQRRAGEKLDPHFLFGWLPVLFQNCVTDNIWAFRANIALMVYKTLLVLASAKSIAFCSCLFVLFSFTWAFLQLLYSFFVLFLVLQQHI